MILSFVQWSFAGETLAYSLAAVAIYNIYIVRRSVFSQRVFYIIGRNFLL